MKSVISAMLAITLAMSAQAALTQSTPARKPLPDSDCLRISQINEWHVVNPRTVIARTGPYKRYLVTLQADCQKLGIGNPGLMFIGSLSDKATQPDRICGTVGEKVRSRYQPGCAIQSLSLIDEATFASYRAKAIKSSVRH
ncbi:hypothetical protein ISP15_03305 [Dyella jejuensis]|uniref:Uncharacterized protein n=1 Tax=Dyella jejuensis TaxID=1432009 RepID=A0ABW8JES0_9GAMM